MLSDFTGTPIKISLCIYLYSSTHSQFYKFQENIILLEKTMTTHITKLHYINNSNA